MSLNLPSTTFINQVPDEVQRHILDDISDLFASNWDVLDKLLPDGPNKTLAYRNLEDACFRAKKAVLLSYGMHITFASCQPRKSA
jgi:hypothetical protein